MLRAISVPVSDFIDASTYAIDPTGNNASDVALNRAIQDSITQRKQLVLPSGLFKINAPLLAYSGYGSGVWIEGQGGQIATTSPPPTYPLSAQNARTIIYATFNDRPAIILSGTYGGYLGNFCIIGQNVKPVTLATITNTQSDWVTGGCRTAQYSPYCGIAIDPCIAASAPPDGGYPGLSYNQSLNGGSSNVLFYNLNIQNFVVGVAIQTGNTATNGDILHFYNCAVNYCDSGYACGDVQTQSWQIIGGNLANCRQFVDCVSYGANGGRNPKSIKNVTCGGMFRLFCLNPTYGPCTISDCYAEEFRMLGFAKDASGVGSPINIIGGDYLFYANTARTPAFPPFFVESNASMTIRGANLFASTYMYTWNIGSFGLSYPVKIADCTMTGTDVSGVAPLIGMTADAGNSGIGIIEDILVHGTEARTLWKDTPRGTNIAVLGGSGRYIGHQSARIVYNGGAADYIYRLDSIFPCPFFSVTALTLNASTVTFTATDASIFQVGDILNWLALPVAPGTRKYYLPMLRVTASNSGSGAVTAAMLFDPIYYDTVANYNAINNNLVAVFPNRWAPTQALTCTTTNTSTSLTLVSPTTILKNGDFVTGAGLQASSRVVSGAGTATIVLNKAATANAAGVALYFDRLFAPTVTAAF